jgi:adenylate cyclase
MVLPPPGSAIFRMPAMPSGDEGATQILAPPSAGTKSAPSSATMAIPMASLVEEKAGGAPVTHRLGALTTIGRTPDNQVVIPSREVSRKHAEVILGEAGHVLRDLGSPNGTFVNGKKITEQPLKDGDSITIAGVTLVFRAK